MKLQAIAAAALISLAPVYAQEPPPLPSGLGSKSDDEQEKKNEEQAGAPALPAGLGDTQAPALPSGLSGQDDANSPQRAEESEPFEAPFGLTGFIEARTGVRVVGDPTQKALSIGEVRAQLGRDFQTRHATFRVVGDLFYDQVDDVSDVDIETGRGFFDLREANVLVRPLDFLDVKAGRQILTWGVGDLVFINDLFPKDYRSFFIGRDDEYLKAPSDAVRISAFNSIANVEFVYTPRFAREAVR